MESSERHELFVRLLARHERELRRYALMLLADPAAVDDVVQETSVSMWRKFDEYQTDQPFLPWACRFAYFEVLKHRKRQRTRRRFFSDATVEVLAQEPIPTEKTFEEERSALEDCLSRLPPADRELIGMRYATRTTIANVADASGLPAKSLYRALERIRRALAECVERKLAVDGGL